jgi:hypothetical protein
VATISAMAGGTDLIHVSDGAPARKSPWAPGQGTVRVPFGRRRHRRSRRQCCTGLRFCSTPACPPAAITSIPRRRPVRWGGHHVDPRRGHQLKVMLLHGGGDYGGGEPSRRALRERVPNADGPLRPHRCKYCVRRKLAGISFRRMGCGACRCLVYARVGRIANGAESFFG